MSIREQGFTFIELTVVVAILGILAAVSIPAFMKNAKKANQGSADHAVTDFSTAEQIYKASVGNSTFGTAPQLQDQGLIDSQLASGRAFGFNFALNLSDDRQHFDLTACPAAINRSGDHCVHVDDTALVTAICPPGQHFDPGTGECVPQDTFISDTGIAAIHAIDQATAGFALPAAKAWAAAVPTLTQQAVMFLDTNHDGLLTADEALNADLLGPTFRPLLAPFVDAIRADLALGIANEQLPGVPIGEIGGDLLEFLNRVPPYVPGGPATTLPR